MKYLSHSASFHLPENIAPSNAGTKHLKRYLQYAETGRLEVGEDLGRDTESPFEEFVKRRLESYGYDVTPQVGVAGYRIDLAIRHPDGAVTLSNRSRVNLAGKFGSRRRRRGLPYAHRFVAKLA